MIWWQNHPDVLLTFWIIALSLDLEIWQKLLYRVPPSKDLIEQQNDSQSLY